MGSWATRNLFYTVYLFYVRAEETRGCSSFHNFLARIRVTRAVAYFLGSLLRILFTKLFASECTRLKENAIRHRSFTLSQGCTGPRPISPTNYRFVLRLVVRKCRYIKATSLIGYFPQF